jgi:predicted enzyme related to lactoylglutathione lyase
MALDLHSVCFDAIEPELVARFWAGVLGWEPADDDPERPHGAVTLAPPAGSGFRLRFAPTREAKSLQNRIHFDLTSETKAEQDATVARALDAGARHIDIGQGPDADHVVLADPEGNEFCVIEAGNGFLAGCGFLGAVNCDGTREVGYFWSQALGWPLVWDQDEETAIQSPQGGAKITWSGPPLMPRPAKSRQHFDLVPATDTDQRAEVERLISLGAKRIDSGQGDVSWVVMADPDGNEFCVLATRG